MSRLAALVLAFSLFACSAIDFVSHPIPGQDKTVALAELSYTLLAQEATAYLHSGHVPDAVHDKILAVDNKTYAALVVARDAVARHDNAAVAVALDALNHDNAELKELLP